MSQGLLVAQTATEDTSSGGWIVLGMLVLVGVVSILALTGVGRRSLMPVVAILLGGSIVYGTINDASIAGTISVLTILGLLVGGTLVLGGFGALREGLVVPQVDGREPEAEPQPPRITPAETNSAQSGANSTEVH